LSANDDQRVLLAYAATRATDIESSGPFAGLIPIFQTISQNFGGQPFKAADLCRELQQSYGLDVPEDLVDYWTRDLVKHHIIEPSNALTLADTKLFYWTKQYANERVGESSKEKLDLLSLPLARS
jgi:hypothetical protein